MTSLVVRSWSVINGACFKPPWEQGSRSEPLPPLSFDALSCFADYRGVKGSIPQMNLDDSTVYTFDAVHTPQNPYCSDLNCWCHSESRYHDVVTQPLTGEADTSLAYTFFGIQQVPEVQAS